MVSPSDLWNRSEGALIDDGMSLRKFIETYGIAGTVLACDARNAGAPGLDVESHVVEPARVPRPLRGV